MSIVSNATPIISLAGIKRIGLLFELFEKISVPEAVYAEIKAKKAPGFDEIDHEFFDILEIKGKEYLGFLLNELDEGEAEAIVLAKEMEADALIIDERRGYAIAHSQGINAIGTLTILLMAKQRGLIETVKPLLDGMILNGRWYSESVYATYLRKIGEL